MTEQLVLSAPMGEMRRAAEDVARMQDKAAMVRAAWDVFHGAMATACAEGCVDHDGVGVCEMFEAYDDLCEAITGKRPQDS